MIRLATPTDWPAIAAWRATHYERMRSRNGKAICAATSLTDAVWLVAGDPHILAAASFFDRPPVRTMYDLYWARGFAGKRAAYVLAATVLQFARDLGLQVQGDTNISNWEYRALLRRVGFSVYYCDYSNDVCYFRRERTEGLHVRKFQSHYANQHQSSRPSAAAESNRSANHLGAAGQ